ncbi:related to light induced alcohol dehydrogenase Bli-4 [Phialocephala subalpina]|uniref:Related to light induced alcohol dehydrogenase Bli-4 n=1 Tax=Phialocephala subalpina TaxID=576137 RepID=A0A1L7X4X2_9HELO|nr:related to light induced alcohol dehydrogenase Bli-4 [Phialocephala subalpina]
MTAALRRTISQLFPGKPTFTEADVPSQNGRVFIVTGGNAGLGYHICKILYSKGGTVYMLSRTESKALEAIKSIKFEFPNSSGDVKYIHLDLSDMTTIKPAVEAFAKQESKLDVLFNNAGIGAAPEGTETKQGYEVIMGTDAIAPFLLTQLLLPNLQTAAKTAPKDSVRVVWTGSPIIEDTYCPPGGLLVSHLSSPPRDNFVNYALSKTANWYLASELHHRVKSDGIVSICQNPGNLKTAVWDPAPWIVRNMMRITMHPPVYGAYTNLWAGVSSSVTLADGGRYAVPWGAWHPNPREDLLNALKSEKERGSGEAAKVWDWLENETKKWA